MSDNKITQDQLEPNVMEELESGIGDLSTLSTENKDSLVAAVTEIYGKNVIAEAIGEPLAVTDTFSEMGSEINSLLSSFKTNMMNSGVTVESGDKFKQLIEKIKGLTEGEGNKGIQFAEGTWDAPGNITSQKWVAYNIASDIGFIPTYIFLYIPYLSTINEGNSFSSSTAQEFRLEDFLVSNINTSSEAPATISNYSHSMQFYFSNISENGFTLNTYSRSAYSEPFTGTCKWYAIGVGEEDTTLRDSLASILENKGIDVTEEDDMASLITKVDNISGGLDIISATELPVTGRENQICVITDNPVGSFVVTSEEDFTSVDKIVVFTTSNSPNYEVNNNNLLCRYCIDSVFLNDMLLDSYYYKNSTWNRLTFSNLCLLYQGRYMMESIHGGLYSGSYIKYTPDTGIVINPYTITGANIISAFSFKNKIDLTNYSTIEITLKGSNTISSCGCYILASTSAPFNYVGSFTNQTVLKEQSLSLGTDYRTYTFDITSAKGEYYIGFGGYMMNYTITISDFKIC